MKLFCVLQVTPRDPNPDHVKYFADKPDCDFFFVTHDSPHPDAVAFCPGTSWAQTRNTLVEHTYNKYMYYAFADYDYDLQMNTGRDPAAQVMHDLTKWRPATASYWPGKGVNFWLEESYRQRTECSVWPFLHVAFRLVHHSLMPWFFPLVTSYDGGWSACHAFNIMEVTLLRKMLLFHGITYHNTKSIAQHSNSTSGWDNMQRLWHDMRDAILWERYSLIFGSRWREAMFGAHDSPDSRTIKEVCLSITRREHFLPQAGSFDTDYMAEAGLDSMFDMNHKMFTERKALEDGTVTPDELVTPANA